MPATNREIRVAQIEAKNNHCWQQVCDVLLADEQSFFQLWKEYQMLCDTRPDAKPFAKFFGKEFNSAAIALDFAVMKIHEEAVRRGLLDEQNLDEPGS